MSGNGALADLLIVSRPLLKRAYFGGLAMMRVDERLLERNSGPESVLVLNLHRITPERNPYWPPMTPEDLDTVIGRLKHQCDIVTFADLTEPYRGRPRVVLSFDDGYRDFIDYAMPILDRHGIRTNQNLIVDSVATGEPPWMTKLVDALNASPDAVVERLLGPETGLRPPGTDNFSKARFGAALTAKLKLLTPEEREQQFPTLTALVRDADPASFTPMLSLADVKSILGVHDLGGHSVDHEAMSLLDRDAFSAQLERCHEFFRDLGTEMQIYAFPYGVYREDQISALQRSGVSAVLLVGERPAQLGQGVYTRITMYGDSRAELRMRAAGHRIAAPI